VAERAFIQSPSSIEAETKVSEKYVYTFQSYFYSNTIAGLIIHMNWKSHFPCAVLLGRLLNNWVNHHCTDNLSPNTFPDISVASRGVELWVFLEVSSSYPGYRINYHWHKTRVNFRPTSCIVRI